jgi:alkylated DNA repair dioxygenase AlkB
MKTILETENSALILHELEEDICNLIKICVEVVDSELDVNPEIIMGYGKVCHQHRSIGFYSDTSKGYNYSSTITPSKKMHPCLRELLIYINDKFDYNYNGILINKYSGGEDYIGKHSDDERGLDSTIGVIALSYGAIRKFRIRNKLTGNIEIDVPTEPTNIIQMAGNFQKEFTHEIPVEKKVKGVRYSLTFRRHLE